jgi:hypothetical protein
MTKPKKKKTTFEEFNAAIEAATQAFNNVPPPPPPHPSVYYAAVRKMLQQWERWLPDDAEARDWKEVQKQIDFIFDRLYPSFDPQVLTTFSPIAGQGAVKEYFLPALKVLVCRDGKYFSPQRGAEWKDMELEASCHAANMKVDFDGISTFEPTGHNAPHEGCDCGIYGSVNIEEITEWLFRENGQQRRYMMTGKWDWDKGTYTESQIVIEEPRNVLCIVEPYPDATVHLCRKGWKASKAFISEIVGETISQSDAERLISEAWQRVVKLEFDIRYWRY